MKWFHTTFFKSTIFRLLINSKWEIVLHLFYIAYISPMIIDMPYDIISYYTKNFLKALYSLLINSKWEIVLHLFYKAYIAPMIIDMPYDISYYTKNFYLILLKIITYVIFHMILTWHKQDIESIWMHGIQLKKGFQINEFAILINWDTLFGQKFSEQGDFESTNILEVKI